MRALRPITRPVACFIGLALGLSVLYCVVAVRMGTGFNRDIWGTVRGFIPAIAGVVTAMLVGDRHPFARIGLRPGRPGGAAWLYVLAIIGPLLVVGLALVASTLLASPNWTLGEVHPGRFVLFFFAMALLDGPLGEELGWRGFFLPTLLRYVGPRSASLIVGVVWFVWHLPLYAADGRALTPVFLAMYLVQLVAAATIYTWFFLRSHGSVLLAIVLHDASNYAQFLASRLFPAMTQGDTVDRFFVAGVAIIGIAAAMDLKPSEAPRAGHRGEANEV